MKRTLFTIMALMFSLTLMAKDLERVAPKPRNVEHLEDGSISIGSIFPYSGLVDPHAWVEDETLYVFMGHDESWRTVHGYRMDRWEIWSTKDLLTWRHERDILPTDTYIGAKPNCWAGDICERDGKYYWVFSNAHNNTGIMVADKITGPYRDLLGEPLLKEGLVKGRVYDPEIYIENGVYTISFGAGYYNFATMSKDMKSLSTEPQEILITKNGKKIWAADKSTLFKHNDWYYLLYGPRYAMSRSLYGPYEEQENQLPSGHNSIFEWKGQYYLIHEIGELYKYYRGVGMQPLYVGNDGRLSAHVSRSVDGSDRFTFDGSKQGWDVEEGTTVEWNSGGFIEGEVCQKGASLSSIPYLNNRTESVKKISFDLINKSPSKRVRVIVSSWNGNDKLEKSGLLPIEWDDMPYVDIEVRANSAESERVEIDFARFGKMEERLRQVRIEPAADAAKGYWAIDNLFIK